MESKASLRKVFISYSHDSMEHSNSVLALADRLRHDGIECILDQYILDSPAEGWPLWMDRQMRDADFVLMICTPTYYRRVMREEQPGIGLGVSWEGNLLYQHAYNAGTINSRFIPILLEEASASAIPLPFQGVAYYQPMTERGYEALYRRLTNQPLTPPPDVGTLRQFPPRERTQLVVGNTLSEDTHHIWNVPYRRNPFFTGRETLLTHLHDHLTTSKTATLTQVQAISGLGGIGKTQIALEYAYRYKDDYQAIFWVRAASRENLVTDFTEIARHLALPEKDEQNQNKVVEAVQRWLRVTPDWLLILDNADEPEIVSGFLPSFVLGHILITTRANAIGNLADSIQVEKMTLQEGIELVLRRAKLLKQGVSLDRVSSQDLITAQKIVEAMDRLPLALDQAGAYIEETGCRLTDYLNLYTTSHKELLQHNSKFASHPNVAITFTLAFQKVQLTSSAAADLLRFFAFLDPDAIPEELIIEGASALGPTLQDVVHNPLKFQETLGLLRNFSLIRRNTDTATLAIHRLVQAIIKDNMDERTYHHWAEQTVKAVSQTFPDVEVANWPQCERYIPHALMSVILIERHRMAFLKATELLFLVGKYFLQRSQLTDAEIILKLDLEITEKAQGLEHPDTALSLNNLALLYHSQGKYEQVEPLYKRALAIFEHALGPEHPDTAQGLNNLALLYSSQGKYEQAEPLYKRALAICEKALGLEHPDIAQSLNNLAALYYSQGKYEQAKPLFKRALAIYEQALGLEHPDTAISLNNLAALYYSHGDYKRAKPLYERALAILKKTFGSNHPSTKNVQYNLATLLENMKKS